MQYSFFCSLSPFFIRFAFIVECLNIFFHLIRKFQSFCFFFSCDGLTTYVYIFVFYFLEFQIALNWMLSIGRMHHSRTNDKKSKGMKSTNGSTWIVSVPSAQTCPLLSVQKTCYFFNFSLFQTKKTHMPFSCDYFFFSKMASKNFYAEIKHFFVLAYECNKRSHKKLIFHTWIFFFVFVFSKEHRVQKEKIINSEWCFCKANWNM